MDTGFRRYDGQWPYPLGLRKRSIDSNISLNTACRHFAPCKLKILASNPVRKFSQPLMTFAHGEHDLKYMIDASLRALHENGFVERTLRKYDPNLESYALVGLPYRHR